MAIRKGRKFDLPDNMHENNFSRFVDEADEEVIPRCPHEHVNIKPLENKDALRKVSSKEEKQFRQKIQEYILFGRSSLEISF